MLGETQNQFSLTRVAISTIGRTKSKFLSVFAAGVVLASVSLHCSQAGMPDNGSAPVTFSVEAEVSLDGPMFGHKARVSRARIDVHGAMWSIHLAPMQWPERKLPNGRVALKPVTYELASDGTNTFEISAYDAAGFQPRLDGQVAEKWPGATPGARAAHREAYALWYAFASSRHCAAWQNGVLAALQPVTGQMHGWCETNTSFPWLPRRVMGTNSEGTHSWQYEARATTNAFGLELPLEAEVSCARLGKPMWGVRISTTSVSAAPARDAFSLSLQGKRTIVYDSTFQTSDMPSALRIETNCWPSSNDVFMRHLRANSLRRDSKEIESRQVRFRYLFVVLGIGIPAAVLAATRLRRKKRL